MKTKKPSRKSIADELFVRADREAEKGHFKTAFRLFRAGAEAGDRSCQLNLGTYYAHGTGVRRSLSAAMYWYKRAYRRGDASAAHNIGVTWRDEKKFGRALAWFKKAVRMGDEESNLEIAKHYLVQERNPARAVPHLEKVCRSDSASEVGIEEAQELLRRARKRTERAQDLKDFS